jgi:hypothetical protein
MTKSPTIPSVDDRGYHYVENAEWWKKACLPLPCFASLEWPDYSTTCIEDVVDGEPIVIQLWKGWCQKFLGRKDFPGGIGAEVGIYRRIVGRRLRSSLMKMPSLLRSITKKAAGNMDSDLWWPYPELGTELEFELINPKTREVFFAHGPQTTYWLCKWMDESSYEQYQRDQKSKVPKFSAEYTLRYRVNGAWRSW